MELNSLEKRVRKIEERNLRVETDKAWEGSLSRRIILVILTYLSIAFYMQAIGIIDPWVNAVIPSIGFLLSTLTLPIFKKIWFENFYKGNNKD